MSFFTRLRAKALSFGLCLAAGGSMSATGAATAEIDSLEYLKDDGGSLTLEQAIASPGWVTNAGKAIDLGFTEAAFWLRIAVTNSLPDDEQLFLRLDNALLHDVRFYRPEASGGFFEIKSGFLAKAPYLNEFKDPKFVFPLSGEHGHPVVHYVRVASTLPLSMRVNLASDREMFRQVRNDSAIFGVIFGILLLMPIYNTLIFIFSRDRNFVIFSAFAVCAALTFFVVEGYFNLFFPDFNLFWKERMLHFFGAGTFFFLIMLERSLLVTRVNTPLLDRLLRGLAALVALIPLVSLFGDHPIYSMISQIASGLIVVTCLITAVRCIPKTEVAPFFILGSFSFLAGTMLFVLQMNGIAPQTMITTHAVHFGAIFQEAFLSFAVAFKINALNTELQQRSQALETANTQLSGEVKQRKQMEAELEVQRSIAIHSAKLRAVGELAAGIAHQVNNPLAVLRLKLDNLGILLRGVAISEKDRTMLEEHLTGTDSHITRLAKVTTSLLRMSRNSANDDVSYLPVEHIAEEALDMCRERFTANGVKVKVNVSTATHTLLIKCNATEVSQALLNLLLNAYDAVLATKDPWLQIEGLPDGDRVLLQVTDSGPGIPDTLRDKIMQPFFTTKEQGKGTGVGLSIAQDLVQRNGAQLYLDTRCPNTRFVIAFSKDASRITELR